MTMNRLAGVAIAGLLATTPIGIRNNSTLRQVGLATIGADGSLHQVCVEGSGAAGAVQGAPALEEK